MATSTTLLSQREREREIPVFEGAESARPAAKGRTIEYEFEEKERQAYLEWPEQWRRKWRPLRDPDDDHILTDSEIDNLLYMINHGYKESAFIGTEQFLKYLKYRQQIPESTSAMTITSLRKP